MSINEAQAWGKFSNAQLGHIFEDHVPHPIVTRDRISGMQQQHPMLEIFHSNPFLHSP